MATKEKAAETYLQPDVPYTLSSRRPVTFIYPDLYDLASGKVDLPNQSKLDIWSLLYGGESEDPKQMLLAHERYTRSLFASAQLVCTPRVKLDDEDETGIIDRREWSLPDLLAAFRFLRFGPPATPARREPTPRQDAPSSSDGLPPGTE